jgi:hypothetical protein
VYREAQIGYGNPPGNEGIDMYTMVDIFAAVGLVSVFAGYDHIVFMDNPQRSKELGR